MFQPTAGYSHVASQLIRSPLDDHLVPSPTGWCTAMSGSGLSIGSIFRQHGSIWREAHRGHINLWQLKVMSAIEHCRSAELGGHLWCCIEKILAHLNGKAPSAGATLRPEDLAPPQARLFD